MLGVQVWEAGTWGDIDQDLGALSTRHRGRALLSSQEIHQLVTQFDRGADQGSAVCGVEAGCYRFPVDRVQFALGAENHAAGKCEPRSSKDPLIPAFPPGQALRAEIWSN